MKIAVCISGEIRTAAAVFEDMKSFLGELYPYCDFFIHCANTKTHKTFNVSNVTFRPSLETNESLAIIEKIYQPKKILMEEYTSTEGYQVSERYGIQPLWYSFWKSIELKNEYEFENNFEYDYVVKLRFDLSLNYPSNSLKKQIEVLTDDNFATSFHGQDLVFISHNKIMNIAAEYLWELIKYRQDWALGVYNSHLNYASLPNSLFFREYMKSMGITYINADYASTWSVVREMYLDTLKQFDVSEYYRIIGVLETYFYNSVDENSDKYFINDLTEYLATKGVVLDSSKKYYLEDLVDDPKSFIEEIIRKLI